MPENHVTSRMLNAVRALMAPSTILGRFVTLFIEHIISPSPSRSLLKHYACQRSPVLHLLLRLMKLSEA